MNQAAPMTECPQRECLLPDLPAQLGIALGKTSLREIERRFAFLDHISNSYTGGPVVILTDWEINIEGLSGLELVFNSRGILDAAVVRVVDRSFNDMTEAFDAAYAPSPSQRNEDDQIPARSYLSQGQQIEIEQDPIDGTILLRFSSDEFLAAKVSYTVSTTS